MILCNQDLLVLLQRLHEVNGHIQHIRNDIRWCERKPLLQGDVCDTVCLIYLDPDQVLFASVLDIMSKDKSATTLSISVYIPLTLSYLETRQYHPH
jgi:hypothetical protein